MRNVVLLECGLLVMENPTRKSRASRSGSVDPRTTWMRREGQKEALEDLEDLETAIRGSLVRQPGRLAGLKNRELKLGPASDLTVNVSREAHLSVGAQQYCIS